MLESLRMGDPQPYLSWKSENPHWECDGESAEIKRFLLDPETIRTGWAKIRQGEAPDFRWNEDYHVRGKAPSDDFTPAFYFQVFCSVRHGAPSDGWRPWQQNQGAARRAIGGVWDDIEKEMIKHKDECAVIEFAGHTATSNDKVNIPNLKLADWSKKPPGQEVLDDPVAPPPESNGASQGKDEFF